MECPVVANENREKQIEQLYFLLLEEGYNRKMLRRMKEEIKELWENNKDFLDVWVLYFLVLQKERNVIAHLPLEENNDNLNFYILNKLNKAVNTEEDSLIVGQKTKEEIKKIIYNCFYNVIKRKFNGFFHNVLPRFENPGEYLKRGHKLNYISWIINDFNEVFQMEKGYKRKISQIVTDAVKERQEKINNEDLAWFDWAEKKYNKVMNSYLFKFFKDINGQEEFQPVNFKFKRSLFWFFKHGGNNNERELLTLSGILGISMMLYSIISAPHIPLVQGEDDLLFSILFVGLFPTMIWLVGQVFMSIDWLLCAGIKTKRQKEQENISNVSVLSKIEENINQALDILKEIPQNENIIALADQIEKYKAICNSFEEIPSVVSSLNVYLSPFLKNIINEKEQLSRDDILSSKEAFISANDTLARLKENNRQLAIEAKNIEFDIAKRELDAINSQFNLDKITV